MKSTEHSSETVHWKIRYSIDKWMINFTCMLVHVDQINMTRRHNSTSISLCLKYIFSCPVNCESQRESLQRRSEDKCFIPNATLHNHLKWELNAYICQYSALQFFICDKNIYHKWICRHPLDCSNAANLTMLGKLGSRLPPLMLVNIVLEIYLKIESAFQMLGLFKCHKFSWN